MNLFCVGLSHHTANVETRERYAHCHDAGQALRVNAGCAEALVLSTCNRVEVYAVAPERLENATIARHLLVPDGLPVDDGTAFYRHEGEQCVQHLFRVASGLDSMVVGETEVLGQAKQAYEQ